MTDIRHNWTVEEILDIYNTPLLELIYKAQQIHREFNDASEVQVSSLPYLSYYYLTSSLNAT